MASRICDFETRIELHEEELERDSDIYALALERQVSVTPLSLDFTSRVGLTELQRTLAR